jgi:hypothetical protein
MVIESRTPEGAPNRCPICGKELVIEPSKPTMDAPCPHCGHLLWFGSTSQALLQEGRVQGRAEARTEGEVAEAKKVLRLIGEGAFGPPDAQTAAQIARLDSLGRLEEMVKRVATAGSWRELIGSP